LLKVGETISPKGSCYITVEFGGREWSSYCSAPPTILEIKAIDDYVKRITDLGATNDIKEIV
jgi:hypothetical protein